MKKLLCLVLALMLAAASVIAFAEEAEEEYNNPYDCGAQEMVRLFEIRVYNPSRSFSYKAEDLGDLPQGLVVDIDAGDVKLVVGNMKETFNVSDADDALRYTVGYVCFETLMGGCADDMPAWMYENGAYEPIAFADLCKSERFDYPARAYAMYMNDYCTMLPAWYSDTYFDGDGAAVRNTIGRIESNRLAASGMNGASMAENLEFDNLPSFIINLEGENILLVQSDDRTYYFSYLDGSEEPMLTFAVYNVLFGGVELEDMDVLSVKLDENDDVYIFQHSADDLRALMDNMADSFVNMGTGF